MVVVTPLISGKGTRWNVHDWVLRPGSLRVGHEYSGLRRWQRPLAVHPRSSRNKPEINRRAPTLDRQMGVGNHERLEGP